MRSPSRGQMIVAHLRAGDVDNDGAGLADKLKRASDVVIVDVSFEDVGDGRIGVARRLDVDVYIPARINDHRDP